MPCAVTTLSTLMIDTVSTIAAIIEPIIHVTRRAAAGTGALMTATDGDWNSRIAGSVGSSAVAGAVCSGRLIALEECRGGGGMARTLAFHVAVLLCPELTIERAAFEQRAVRREVDDGAALHHHDLVALGQRRQPVRDDHHGTTAGDAQQVGVDQRLAFRIERAGRFVKD